MVATAPVNGLTYKVAKSTKSNLGPPSEHTPHSAVDYNEATGTESYAAALYPHYLPVWETPQARYSPLEAIDFKDHAFDADKGLPDLLGPESRIRNLTPVLGAEVFGVQLSQLTPRAKDQLALLTNDKKVLVFREQDFASLPIKEAVDYCRYFGRLFLHSHSGAPKGHPEIHIVHSRAGNTIAPEFFEFHTHSMTWHSDNSFDIQPPGITFLYALEVPAEGGDTVFADAEKAYERLSSSFQKTLEGLEAIHTSRDQSARAVAGGGYVRREPIDTTHPIVRTNPLTGKKSLFVNPSYTRQVVGFKKEESDYLLKFLYNHITLSQDLQCRVRWENGTVVVFDNRNTCHSGILDWMDGRRRHIAR
ncbi:hypothetical protein ED733_001625 [Metarhizium rileyi]|uniref:TauD/TfdA-like domain-containing protein n=1 Tax=Metarhizium rileyi (strain RCEF 4871) TaxID=1649241 RepID=A0A5C6G2S1_METRR|nr:hypothetical protein ED733_001625 [Metarhizium rileyi]